MVIDPCCYNCLNIDAEVPEFHPDNIVMFDNVVQYSEKFLKIGIFQEKILTACFNTLYERK